MNRVEIQEKLFIQNKECSRCHVVKDISEFTHDAAKKDGYEYWCKSCMSEYSHNHYQKNKERKSELARIYRNNNKDKINAWVREYRAEKKLNAIKNGKPTPQQRYYKKTKEDKHNHYELRKEIIKDKNMFRKYGITIDQRDTILYAQNNRCAICGELFGGDRNPHIDHDHQTKKVRGILCSKCNTGIGMFDENTKKLKNAVKYLED